MPVADTNIDSWAATVLDLGRDRPPSDADILLTFMACAQQIDHLHHIHVHVQVTAQNGIPEFLLSYVADTDTPRFTGILASWEPRNRRLYVRDAASPVHPQIKDLLYSARFHLLLLRQCQIKWGARPLTFSTTDLV